MNIQFYNMEISDLDLISDTLISDFDDFWTYSVLKEELESNNSQYFVAKIHNEIVGFAGIKIVLDECDLMNIVIKKSYRNQGIGKKLLEHIICIAKNQKLISITLEVNESNFPAISLYKNLGFENIGIRKNYYQNNNGLLMCKKLSN